MGTQKTLNSSSNSNQLNSNMTSSSNMMSKIVFFEERNFQGRSYECSSDCADMSSYLSRCQSCRVERGCFMVYDRTNFMGNQYFLRRGEYSDYMSMMGMSDCEDIMERFRMSNCMSCNVMEGHWLMFEQPQFRGRMVYMRPGEHRTFMNLGMGSMRFMSMRRILDSCY